MLVKNNARRLITIRSPLVKSMNENGRVTGASEGKPYRILPAGPAVDIPKKLFESKFVQAMIESGDLLCVGEGSDKQTKPKAQPKPAQAPKQDPEPDNEPVKLSEEEEFEALKKEADELGVEYGARIGIETLRERVEAARK